MTINQSNMRTFLFLIFKVLVASRKLVALQLVKLYICMSVPMTERKCIACVASVSRVWAEVSDTQGEQSEVLFLPVNLCHFACSLYHITSVQIGGGFYYVQQEHHNELLRFLGERSLKLINLGK